MDDRKILAIEHRHDRFVDHAGGDDDAIEVAPADNAPVEPFGRGGIVRRVHEQHQILLIGVAGVDDVFNQNRIEVIVEDRANRPRNEHPENPGARRGEGASGGVGMVIVHADDFLNPVASFIADTRIVIDDARNGRARDSGEARDLFEVHDRAPGRLDVWELGALPLEKRQRCRQMRFIRLPSDAIGDPSRVGQLVVIVGALPRDAVRISSFVHKSRGALCAPRPDSRRRHRIQPPEGTPRRICARVVRRHRHT